MNNFLANKGIGVNVWACFICLASFVWIFPLSNFLLPLLLWLLIRDKDEQLDLHGKNLLNFQFTWGMGIVLLWCILLVISVNRVFFFGFSLAWLLPMLTSIIGVVFLIMATVSAFKGKLYQLPAYKFFK
jgi:uncharacterized Tic20 family protein